MGKVVHSARFTDEKYLVAIPRIASIAEPQRVTELDERFASPRGMTQEGIFEPDDAAFIETVLPTQPEIDWQAVHRDADALIDLAASDGKSLLTDARVRCEELIAQAQSRCAEIEGEARARAHEEGIASGRESIAAQMSTMVETLRELIASTQAERHKLIDSAEPELVRLALAVAERIVHQQIAIDPNVVVENVRGALARLVSREVVTLRVNPTDLDAIRQHRDAIVASNDVEHLRIVEDQRVDRGGVVLETDAGTIDAKISTQLREARKAMQSDESIALGPSGDEGVLHSSAQAS